MEARRIKYQIVLYWCVLFFCSCVCSLFGEGVFGEKLHKQVFPVIGKGVDTRLAAEAMIVAYPEGATFSAVRDKISSRSNAEMAKIPEYILLKEHELAARGNLQEILDLYDTKNDKEFAANERWMDMDYSSSYIRENIDDYVLKSKARFGPFVFIRYKPILKKGRAFSWSVVLKETEKGYLFTRDLGDDHIFLLVAHAFPYWEDVTKRHDVGNLDAFQVARFRHNESDVSVWADPNFVSPGLQLYHKLERFSQTTLITAPQKERVQDILHTVLEGYNDGNPELLVSAWTPSSRSRILKHLEDEVALKVATSFFRDVEHIEAEYVLKFNDELFLYTTPIDIVEAHKVSKLFRFKLENGKYFLDAEQGTGNPYGRAILASREFLSIIEKLKTENQ